MDLVPDKPPICYPFSFRHFLLCCPPPLHVFSPLRGQWCMLRDSGAEAQVMLEQGVDICSL